jgi:hypothetical protein
MFLSATEAPAKGGFEPHPKGLANGVCVEVITHNKKTGDPFTRMVEGDTKNRIILVFQTDKTATKEDGSEVNCVYWDWHNVPQSIANESASLHKRLKGWEVDTTKDFSTKEDFEAAVVGRAATLMFTHNESNGKTYANLDVCTPLEDASKAFVAKDYQTYNEVAPF